MRTLHSLTVLAVLALAAGCVTPNLVPSGLVDDGAAGVPLAWDVSGCKVMVGAIPVQASAMQPFLPEGFRALTPAEAGLPPLPGAAGDAVFGLEAFVCASGVNGTTEAPYASFFAFVEPPAHLVDPEVDFMHFVKWDTLVADAGMRGALVAAGLPARDGDVAPGTVDAAIGAGYAMQLTLTLDGLVYGLHAATPAPAQPFTGTFAEFTPKADGGLAKWKATVVPTDLWQAAGYVKLPTEGMAFEIVGMERAPALFYVGTDGAFTNATLELDVPAAPAG